MSSEPIDVGTLLDARPAGGYQKLLVGFVAATIVLDGADNQPLGIAIPAPMRDWSVPRAALAPVNAVQIMLYSLAVHVYPTRVRATGLGSALAVGRSGAVLSTYAGEWTLSARGSPAFFGLVAASMATVFGALAIVERHMPRREM